MTIGDRLRAIRKKRHLTLGGLTELTGLSPAHLSRVENGKAKPSLDAVEKWARALQVPMHHILYGEEELPALPNLPDRLTADDIVEAIPQSSRPGPPKGGAQPLRKERPVIPRFDIFKADKDGHLIWCASANNLDDAKAQISTLRESDPCEYDILSQDTRKHIRFRPFPEVAED
jgi:transcriptional regulator with XRE-family HTH domain